MQHYGAKLNLLREKQGIGTLDVAKALGVSLQRYTLAEKTGEFSVNWLPTVARVLKIPVSKLVRLSGRKGGAEKPVAQPKAPTIGAPPKKKKKRSAKSAAPAKKAVGPTPKAANDGETWSIPAAPAKKRGRPRKNPQPVANGYGENAPAYS